MSCVVCESYGDQLRPAVGVIVAKSGISIENSMENFNNSLQ